MTSRFNIGNSDILGKAVFDRATAHVAAMAIVNADPIAALERLSEGESILNAKVDPELLEAREVVAAFWEAAGDTLGAERTRSGIMDDNEDVGIAVAALKRGRELAEVSRNPDTPVISASAQRVAGMMGCSFVLNTALATPATSA